MNPLNQAMALLDEAGIALAPEFLGRLDAYEALLKEWNPRAGLMSRHEISAIPAHFCDSLSLAPYLRAGLAAGPWVDVGSGGGFPAIPLALALGGEKLSLIERNQKKIGFLRKALARLELRNVSMLDGSFPEILAGLRPSVLTARAVEKPELIIPAIREVLADGGVYLAQRTAPLPGWEELFHVEQVRDGWGAAGLRRGQLFLLRPR